MDSILIALEKILEERKSASADQSYVSSLYSKGTNSILEKISEESEEVINAVNEEGRKEIIHEVADLWFHLLVLLRHEDIKIKEIETELARRFGISGHDEKASRETK
jgi:phosphoribosyl-ATP pyrophosphohydrolase